MNQDELTTSIKSVQDETLKKKMRFLITATVLFFLAIFVGFKLYAERSKTEEKPIIKQEETTVSVDKKTLIFEPDPVPVQLSEPVLEIKPEINLTSVEEKPAIFAVEEQEIKKNSISKSRSKAMIAINNNKTNDDKETNTANDAITAYKSKLDPDFTLAKGTFIGCSLKTKIVSTIAGSVGCTITEDIFSANGAIKLIEKGSSVFGTFQSGQLKQGQNRIFVMWEQIRTPHNVIVNINSGATDNLGASGVEGWVDTHFWQRFGAAMMISLIDDTAAIIAARQKNGDVYFGSTRENSQEMATKALENTINIAPTLYKHHGDVVGIHVAKDVDFSKVYQLTMKRGF